MAPEEKSSPQLELARQLFKEHYARCFWHLKPDLIVTDEMMPIIIKGLCAHGGRQGMLAAAKLQEAEEK